MAVSANPSKSMDSLGDTINPILFFPFSGLSLSLLGLHDEV